MTGPEATAIPMAMSTASAPEGVGYSLLLVSHVLAAVVGFGALVLTGAQAARARRGPGRPGAAGVQRYFRPGVNWPGRALYAVPVLGFALVGASAGAFHAGQGFVVIGLGLWALSTVVAEVVVWPGERRIQAMVSERWKEATAGGELAREARRVAAASVVLSVVCIAGLVVMVAKP
ncbi:MAG TPA: DUF2269 family protein [Acidimicrobiales bacterium]|nr:DUF2269 family protein [Acidimicrobiales bacterium]